MKKKKASNDNTDEVGIKKKFHFSVEPVGFLYFTGIVVQVYSSSRFYCIIGLNLN